MLHPTRLDPESTTLPSHAYQPPGAVPPGPARGGRWPRRVRRLGAIEVGSRTVRASGPNARDAVLDAVRRDGLRR